MATPAAAAPPAPAAEALAALQLPDALLPLLPALAALLPLAQAAQARLDERIAGIEAAHARKVAELETSLAELQRQVAELQQQADRPAVVSAPAQAPVRPVAAPAAEHAAPSAPPTHPPVRTTDHSHTNHFDRLPTEIKHRILRRTDFVSQVLSGYIGAATLTPEQRTTLCNIPDRTRFEKVMRLEIPSLKDGLQQAAMRNNWVDLVNFADKDALLRNACTFDSIDQVDYYLQPSSAKPAFKGEPRLAVDTAAANGNLDIVQWLYGESVRCSVIGLFGAIHHKHKSVVDWLVANDRNLALFAPRG
ncbi:hypothetical protein HK105_204296 [Polyrhizophydium stewartii]|uniref:Uncharacterized protein n=1 Tax=Polyrhizophydium stewartii TaxID=2732419 RepID=A0ABR4N9K0_9FUNG